MPLMNSMILVQATSPTPEAIVDWIKHTKTPLQGVTPIGADVWAFNVKDGLPELAWMLKSFTAYSGKINLKAWFIKDGMEDIAAPIAQE